jgi:mono/diheme cytochrome c family protein
MAPILLAGVLPVLLWLPLSAGAEPLTPPFDLQSPEIIQKGRAIFNGKCDGGCHGRDGRQGMDGPALKGRSYFTPEYVFVIITYGKSGTAMPKWKDRITEEEIWLATAFVLSLQAEKH